MFHLDANPERVGEIADQIAEIDPSFGDEIENRLAPVESVVGVDQLHLKPMRADSLDAQVARIRLAREVFFFDVEVVIGRNPHNRAHRGDVDRTRRFVRLDLDRADSGACFALYQHSIAALKRCIAGQEIVQVASLLQANRNDFRQRLDAFKRIDIVPHVFLPRLSLLTIPTNCLN